MSTGPGALLLLIQYGLIARVNIVRPDRGDIFIGRDRSALGSHFVRLYAAAIYISMCPR